MISMIAADFDVEEIARGGNAHLFAARRPSVWHFVMVTEAGSGARTISQFHYPRYLVARAIARHADGVRETQCRQEPLIYSSEEGGLAILIERVLFEIDPEFVEPLRADLESLAQAVSRVQKIGENYALPHARSHQGHPVVVGERPLGEAIAFEEVTSGTLDATVFGVYSAFCTWRDFFVDDPSRRHVIAESEAAVLAEWDASLFNDSPYLESALKIQDRIFERRFWAPGQDFDLAAFTRSLSSAFEKLTDIQFAQFVLMNGMHEGGLLHALAAAAGVIDFNEYAYWRTIWFQPDAEEEQEIREQTAFIQLLGISDTSE